MRNPIVPHRNILSRFFLMLLVLVIVASPFSYLARTIVHASNQWVRITNQQFGEDNYAVKSMVKIGTDVYFYTQSPGRSLNVYNFDGVSVTLISSDLYADENNINVSGMVVVQDTLIITVNNSEMAKILMYVDGTWQSTNELFPLPAGIIRGISSYQDTLVVWLWETVDSESGFLFGLRFSITGDVLSSVATGGAISFGDAQFNDMSIEQSYTSGVNFYIVGSINSDVDVFVYNLDGTWSRLGDAFHNTIDDIILFQGNLYVTTHDWSSRLKVFIYDVEVWVEMDLTGIDETNILGKFGVSEDVLMIVTAKGSTDNAEILALADEDGWFQMCAFIGQAFPEVGDETSWSTAAISYNNGLLIGAGTSGEGPYNARIWSFNADLPIEDSDGDSVDNMYETAGPNSGDANNDTYPDWQESMVSTFLNPVTGHYVVLESDGDYTISVSMAPESTDHADGAFSYPFGLMNFQIQAGTAGRTITITQYFYGDYDASLMVARKYNETTHTYLLIPGAVITNEVIGGQKVVKVVYQIEDGGALDQDGLVDGVITDPAGPALNAVGVPDTGLGRNILV